MKQPLHKSHNFAPLGVLCATDEHRWSLNMANVIQCSFVQAVHPRSPSTSPIIKSTRSSVALIKREEHIPQSLQSHSVPAPHSGTRLRQESSLAGAEAGRVCLGHSSCAGVDVGRLTIGGNTSTRVTAPAYACVRSRDR